MVTPHSVISDKERYGLGFWLDGSGEAVRLEGATRACRSAVGTIRRRA